MRLAAKVDGNHPDIVEALRAMGCSVRSLAALGHGVPDLLVGIGNLNLLLEVKDGSLPPSKQKLTEDELTFHASWNGQVTVVRSPEEAVNYVGAAMYMAADKR